MRELTQDEKVTIVDALDAYIVDLKHMSKVTKDYKLHEISKKAKKLKSIFITYGTKITVEE